MKKRFSTIILIVVFFAGLSVTLYPSVSDYWNCKRQTRAIIDYETRLQQMSDEEYDGLFAAADDYNRRIREQPSPFIYYDSVDGYEDALNVNGTGMMGYIKIEKLNAELPVYHSVSPSVLNVAVGHIPGSSLPVGGKNTHAALSAHRGLPSAKLFSNLDKLTEGDSFTLSILNRSLTYEVDQILIVEPDQVDELYVKEGGDYCTLVTCTPYGVNSHRLLVRGRRIETPESATAIRATADATQIEPLLAAPLVASPMLLGLLILLLVKDRKKKQAI